MGSDRPLAQQQAQLFGLTISARPWQVTLLPGGEVFECAPDRSLLDAAHGANLLFPYSCRGGRCGTCRGRLVSGNVVYPAGPPDALDEEQRVSGYVLFCSAFPVSDLTIELATPSLDELQAIAMRKFASRT
ncbi:MAG: 2Fe-2S iron-sulfur cluster-binding protein [Gammaproteobacteria bacterium]|nr:2Fe-2S iron-sulfur cluster-binding protein [Gammaproteobacteria bacterium]